MKSKRNFSQANESFLRGEFITILTILPNSICLEDSSKTGDCYHIMDFFSCYFSSFSLKPDIVSLFRFHSFLIAYGLAPIA
jgi:hypothetical protein